MKSTVSAFLALLALCFSGPVFAEKPNIIFILADDLGYGDLGCFGQETLKTPHLDRMAAEGMKLTRHYSGSTVCAPSRCVLMTGYHTGHCSVRGNQPALMKDEDFTVAELLKQAGYRTGLFGKWGIGNPPPRDDPNKQGFDEFYGYVNMYHAHNFYPPFLIRNGEVEELRNVTKPFWLKGDRVLGEAKEGSGVASVKKDYAPDLITAEALKFIDANKDGPFFLYHALNTPHANNEGGSDKEQQDGMEVPDYGEFAKRDWPNPEKGFAAMIRNIDRDAGLIFEKLKEHGIDEKTIVFFSSDNGPHQEGKHQMEYFDSNGPLRGMKRDLYDGGVRVPTIVRWPGKISPGSASDRLSGFQDFFPTAAELAGIKFEAAGRPIDGISLVPTLLQITERPVETHKFLYWEFLERGGKVGITTEKWKAIQQNAMKNPPGKIELYDLENDPGEQNDVAADHPELVAKFKKWMEESHAE
ncbi:MAG: arylsulfatase [Verrucomicrobiales bacterium]|nr:arylsulfatase [Verrucomicrobiales bacterium]